MFDKLAVYNTDKFAAYEIKNKKFMKELCSLNRNDLLKFRNFGKKSLTELDEKLAELNLSFGTDTSIYKLDKE